MLLPDETFDGWHRSPTGEYPTGRREKYQLFYQLARFTRDEDGLARYHPRSLS
jgi:hypothetical protein